MKFVLSFALGIFFALIDGLIGWVLLGPTFDLGYWVWVGLAFFIANAVGSATGLSKGLDKL